MAEIKRFLDFPGLEAYDKLIKEYIKTGSTDEIDKIVLQLSQITAKDEAQDQAIQAVQDAVEILNGDSSVEGSVANQVQTAVADLVDGAPEALDTLKEIADWIGEDETGTVALVNRVAANESAIEDLKAQDQAIMDSIQPIKEVEIVSLFPVDQKADQTAVEAINAIEDGQALKLAPAQTITEDLVIDKTCYIDANGATFEGQVVVPATADVIIENATFSNPVVMV